MNEIKLNGQTPNITQENINKLMEMFPEVATEGKVDIEKLQQLLGEYAEDKPERYNFTWNGKSRALRISQTPSTGTLRPCKDESEDWDTTQNLYIEGDNLEVLKLLQKSYHGKVKMIYIDPPYNTGGDFVYKDDFKDNIKNYKEITGQVDGEGKNLSTNAETSGRYHTDWLNMMYPRLRLARNLLTDDGVIFISIDDNEVENLKKVCNEIFGESSFITDIIWEKRFTRNNDAKLMSSVVDHILMYRKSAELVKIREPRTEKANSIYSNPDNDPRGPWTSVSYVSQRTKDQRPNLSYPVVNPQDGRKIEHPVNAWKYSEEAYLNHEKENRIYWGKEGNNSYPRLKRFLNELNDGMVPTNLWHHKDVGTLDDGTKIVDGLIGKDVFDYPKPTTLIIKMLQMIVNNYNNEENIVLDFFSGSATTAHAVMQLNAEDGGNLKYIMVQLPEPCDEKSEAYKSGYKNIAEIGKERIRRAGKKIKEEHGDAAENLDIGFKVLKLDNSNIRRWNPDPEDLQTSLEDHLENFVAGRNELDVVYEIMLKYGLDLTYPVEEYEVAGQKIYAIGFGMLMICLGDKITTKVAEGILKLVKELEPESARVVCRDNGFASDSEKTNVKEILNLGGIEEFISI